MKGLNWKAATAGDDLFPSTHIRLSRSHMGRDQNFTCTLRFILAEACCFTDSDAPIVHSTKKKEEEEEKKRQRDIDEMFV